MPIEVRITPPEKLPGQPLLFLIELIAYVAVMFLIREVYFTSLSFIANGLFWSLTTLVFASWRMRARGVSWRELGLCLPNSVGRAALATAATAALCIASIIIFQILVEIFSLNLSADTSNESAVQKFGKLKGNWMLFLSIIPLIWLQSMLEELLDRGFLINWIENSLGSTAFATIVAVLLQAMIFGFRHANDVSERSITVALIGLAMGIGYVAFGRNLWPLIIVHCALNTMSMLGRVV